MAKKPIWKPRYIKWRDGRPRFEPGPRERKLGFVAKDLRHGEAGPWFTMEETRAWGVDNLARIIARRAGVAPVMREKRGESVKDLLDAYLGSPDFASLAGKTQADQRRLAGHVHFEKPVPVKAGKNPASKNPASKKAAAAKRTLISEAPAKFIEPADVKGFFEKLERERGLAMARSIIMLLSAAFRWARTSPAWRIALNPCHRLDLRSPEPRVFVWTEIMIARMVAAADALGLPEIGDTIYMGVFTGQRLADRLELVDGGLIDGARVFRQNKTGAVVMIPEMPQLSARLSAAKARRRAAYLSAATEGRKFRIRMKLWWHDVRQCKRSGVKPLFTRSGLRSINERARKYVSLLARLRIGGGARLPKKPKNSVVSLWDATIMINEKSGRSFSPRHYNTVFNLVKAAAIAGIPKPGSNEWIVEPCPALADARDQDLRDTAVTWLAIADCTLMQISGITGHSIASIQTTIRHYLAIDPRLAGAAIAKLRDWMDKEGMRL